MVQGGDGNGSNDEWETVTNQETQEYTELI